MLGIGARTRRSLRSVRLGMELTMLFCGWLLGGSVGAGTVVTGLLIGPAMQFWLHRLGATPPSGGGRGGRGGRGGGCG
jgi:uncharacterized membrane protein YczE